MIFTAPEKFRKTNAKQRHNVYVDGSVEDGRTGIGIWYCHGHPLNFSGAMMHSSTTTTGRCLRRVAFPLCPQGVI